MKNWISYLIVAFALSSCGGEAGKLKFKLVEGQSSPTQTNNSIGKNASGANAILTANCASCHDNGVSMGGLGSLAEADLIQNGYLIPGDPANSRVYIRMNDGTMPPSGSLSSGDITSVYTWIADMQGTVSLPALAPTYTSLRANVFNPKCIGCHNDTNKNQLGDGYSMDDYVDLTRKVNAGNPNESAVYKKCAEGEMPPSRNNSLTQEELNALYQWIANGALDN